MMIQLLSDTRYLTRRALREIARQPALEVGNVFIPLFFFAVTVGAIGGVSAKAFGVTNYTAFQLPGRRAPGRRRRIRLGRPRHCHRYRARLLRQAAAHAAPAASRSCSAASLADGVRTMALTLLIVVVGLIFGPA